MALKGTLKGKKYVFISLTLLKFEGLVKNFKHSIDIYFTVREDSHSSLILNLEPKLD